MQYQGKIKREENVIKLEYLIEMILKSYSKLMVSIYLSESINTKTEENSTVANHDRDENSLM